MSEILWSASVDPLDIIGLHFFDCSNEIITILNLNLLLTLILLLDWIALRESLVSLTFIVDKL